MKQITEMPKIGDVLYYCPDSNTKREVTVIEKPKDVTSDNIIGIHFVNSNVDDIIIARFHDGFNIFLFKED